VVFQEKVQAVLCRVLGDALGVGAVVFDNFFKEQF
jgi:hypothetical protein